MIFNLFRISQIQHVLKIPLYASIYKSNIHLHICSNYLKKIHIGNINHQIHLQTMIWFISFLFQLQILSGLTFNEKFHILLTWIGQNYWIQIDESSRVQSNRSICILMWKVKKKSEQKFKNTITLMISNIHQ